MQNCPRFEICDAPLCPLDPDLALRIWYAGEETCKCQKYNKHRWIRKQRSIVRRQTKTWLDRPVIYQQLYDASRPKNISEERKAEMAKRLSEARAKYARKNEFCRNSSVDMT